MLKRFKVTYKNGYSIEEAPDVFALMVVLKRDWKRHFKMPIKIEEVDGAQ